MNFFGASTGNLGVDIVLRLLEAYNLVILIRVVCSWMSVDRTAGWYRVLFAVTEPVLRPLRRLIPPANMVDFSPMVAMLAIAALERLVIAIAF